MAARPASSWTSASSRPTSRGRASAGRAPPRPAVFRGRRAGNSIESVRLSIRGGVVATGVAVGCRHAQLFEVMCSIASARPARQLSGSIARRTPSVAADSRPVQSSSFDRSGHIEITSSSASWHHQLSKGIERSLVVQRAGQHVARLGEEAGTPHAPLRPRPGPPARAARRPAARPAGGPAASCGTDRRTRRPWSAALRARPASEM